MKHKKRYINSFVITSILYSSLIAISIFFLDDHFIAKGTLKKSDDIVKFTIIEQIPPIKKQPKPQKVITKKMIKKVVKKKIKPKPKKIVTKKVIKKEIKPKPKKVITKKTKPKTILKHKQFTMKTQKPKPKKVFKTIKPKPVTKTQIERNISKTKENIIEQELKTKKRDEYYTKIKQTINSNKSYPKIAIRRQIQGSVKIQFIVSKKGELISYKIISGKKIFYKSVIKAIQKTFPLAPPKEIFISNSNFSLTLQYKLY